MKETLSLVRPVADKPTVDLTEAVRALLPGPLYDSFVEQLRGKLRAEELAELTKTIGQLSENIDTMKSDIIRAASDMPGAIAAGKPSNDDLEDDRPDVVRLGADELIVSDLEMDFLEVHAVIAKSVIDKRPVMMGVRSGYTNDYEPQLQINDRDGKYGIDHHMRTVTLVLTIRSEEVQVDGHYWDTSAGVGGRDVPLTREQIDRILRGLVEIGRKATGFDPASLRED